MIVLATEHIGNIKPIKNCRVQSLCYLLNMKKIAVTPQILYLLCPKPLYFFANIRQGNAFFPFLGSFYPDIEERFLKEAGLNYGAESADIEYPEICSILDSEDSRIFLCDADSILRHARDSGGSPQIGVCSSVVATGHDGCGNIYIPHSTLAKEYEKLSFDLLSYARNRVVLPSSPLATSIWVEVSAEDAKQCSRALNDYDYMLSSLIDQMLCFAKSEKRTPAQYTNNGTNYYTESAAIAELCQFFDEIYKMIDNKRISEEIKNKLFILKLMVLRKSMISGTNTFNRTEIAESIFELYKIAKAPIIKDLYDGFQSSAITYRNIIRMLYFTMKKVDDKEGYLREIRELFDKAIAHEQRIVEKFLEAAI